MVSDPGSRNAATSGYGMRAGGVRAVPWLLNFVRPHAWRLAVVVVLSLASVGLTLAQPYITKFLIDDGLMAGNLPTVIALCALLFGVGVIAALLTGVNRWQYVNTSGKILFAIRQAVYAHLQRLSPAFYARARGGDLLNRLDGDVAEVQRFAVDSLLAMVSGAIALAGALALMVLLSWQLSLLAFVLLPAEFLFLRYMRPLVERRTRAVRERASDLTAFFFDTLAAMKFIQSVAAEQREAERLAGLNRLYLSDLVRQQMTGFVAATVPGLLTSLSTAVVFVAGGYLLIKGQMTLGALIAFSVYLSRATGPVQTLLGLYVAAQRAKVSLQRVLDLMTERPVVTQPSAPRAVPADAMGEIRFEDVVFSYRDGERPILNGVNLAVPARTRTGLVGVSGAGKTTVIDLLHRHYDPQGGRILIDGIDVREMDLTALRRRVAVVAQDTVLFAGSVFDNIRYAAPTASDADIREAAALAQIDDFICRLPHGYETDVGARGTALSGGQRQRLAIARALLQDPLVLVLDEATSSIDRETEVRISEAIDRLFADRTRLVITHRPEPLSSADLVVELAAGQMLPVSATTAGSSDGRYGAHRLAG